MTSPFLVRSIEKVITNKESLIYWQKIESVTPKFCYTCVLLQILVIILMQSAICFLLVNALIYLNNPNVVNK